MSEVTKREDLTYMDLAKTLARESEIDIDDWSNVIQNYSHQADSIGTMEITVFKDGNTANFSDENVLKYEFNEGEVRNAIRQNIEEPFQWEVDKVERKEPFNWTACTFTDKQDYLKEQAKNIPGKNFRDLQQERLNMITVCLKPNDRSSDKPLERFKDDLDPEDRDEISGFLKEASDCLDIIAKKLPNPDQSDLNEASTSLKEVYRRLTSDEPFKERKKSIMFDNNNECIDEVSDDQTVQIGNQFEIDVSEPDEVEKAILKALKSEEQKVI